MSGQRVSRLRKVALTGALTPGLILGAVGAVGFGIQPGGILPTGVAAQSVIEGGTCTAFGAPAASQATEMSVADVAEKVNPAVVTVLNLQPLSEVELSGFSGIEGFPGMPELPGIGELPGSDDIEGSDELPSAPDADEDDEDDEQQIEESADDDTLVPAGTGSGFIVDELGHVVTNAHVVAGAEELTVSLADGTEVPATVVGSDAILDVAIIQLDLPEGAFRSRNPPLWRFFSPARWRPGDCRRQCPRLVPEYRQ